MTESSRIMFQQVLSEIDQSHVDADMKDQTKGLVFQVMKFNNGSSNEMTDIKDTLTLMSVFLIRHTLRNSSSGMETKAMNSRLGMIIMAIKPIAWPLSLLLSVAVFSPHFNDLINLIKEIIK